MDVFDSITLEKLLLFLLIFIPGFISMKVYEIFTSWGKTDFSKQWYDAIAYSTLNFIAFSWLIAFIYKTNFYTNHKILSSIIFIFIGIICPALWGILFPKFSCKKFYSKWTERLRSEFRKLNPPTPWDRFFTRENNNCWVILHLKDGSKVGGKFDTDSYASAYPEKEQIYLEEVWELDESTDAFLNPYPGTYGLLISGDVIKYIEFFK